MTKSSEPIIKVRGLSKSYQISHRERVNTHPTLKDDIVRALRAPLRLIDAAGGLVKERFWALKNVDLDIYPGEVVALMGVNGSGKSTLLKILSRITQPEEGEAWLKGRTNSLLEVGTGFHEELTGRENVYFNGSILGMKKVEIDKKFDEIVKFSEVGDFLDTPVKHYSSGMRVRLAFSIAAHLEPDILLIDEVLAVGDVRFKQKSIKRMKQIAESGTTIVFVSHVVGHIRQICTRGIVLDHGKIVFNGELEEGIETYLKLNRADETAYKAAQNEESVDQNLETGDVSASIDDIDVVSRHKRPPSLDFELKVNNLKGAEFNKLWVGIVIKDSFGKSVAPINSLSNEAQIDLDASDKSVTYKITIDSANLAPGRYNLSLSIKDSFNDEMLYRKSEAGEFEIPTYSLAHTKFSNVKDDTFHLLLDYEFKSVKNEKRH